MIERDTREVHPVEWLIFAIFSLNVLDAVATIAWVWSGVATEANPLMAHLLEIHPLLFFGVKSALVLLGSALLWLHRDRPFAIGTLVVLFAVYYGLLLFHLDASATLFWDAFGAGV